MSPTAVIEIGRDLLMTSIMLSLPAVVISLAIGLVISILQTVTGVQEQTLTFAPRMIGVAAVTLLAMPWLLRVASSFTYRMFYYMLETVQ